MISKSKTNKSVGVGGSKLDHFLPEVAVTKEGVLFNPRDDTWSLHDGGMRKTFKFAPFYELCTDLHFVGLKNMLIYLLERQSLASAANFRFRYLNLCKFTFSRNDTAIDSLSVEDVLSFRATLVPDDEHQLHSLRGCIKSWRKLGFHGIDEDVPDVLDKLKLKKNKTGTAVRTRDPQQGPFNDEEFQDILQYVLDAYADGKMSLADMALAFLSMTFGARPVSFSALRLQDLIVDTNEFGIDKYTLEIPAAKRREGGRRTHFLTRTITPEYGDMMVALKKEVLRQFEKEISEGLDPNELPFFTSKDPNTGYVMTSDMLLWKLKAAFTRGTHPLTVRRPGYEGEPLRMNLKRFRYTLGTRMAEEGKRQREIAEALGHKAVASAAVYVKVTKKVRDRINDAVSPEMAPLAKYFLGEIISKDEEAAGGFGPPNRIRSFGGKLKGESVGNCGKSGFCGGFIPLPCYECRSFRPWLEAPHEEVLFWLLSERKRKIELGLDERMVAINDPIIKKVADVARRCKKIQEEIRSPKELPNA